ncbi:hypothetical protein GARC_3127 [Paraglaciecola arctica BSs20135]|uniref:Uncharacterized protein n=1 Tax=Paraglaciecola arctica BSs20135 TaxID=493475 RepID=K6Y7Z8_9ALTE|nr:hypothetical protein GARC_3127 [Paraglaciecola arctica BSs20135]
MLSDPSSGMPLQAVSIKHPIKNSDLQIKFSTFTFLKHF